MPFEVRQRGKGNDKYWAIYKINQKVYAKPKFRSRTAAMNQARNWLSWRFEDSKVRVKK